jgi:hypothetical protein
MRSLQFGDGEVQNFGSLVDDWADGAARSLLQICRRGPILLREPRDQARALLAAIVSRGSLNDQYAQ